MENKLELIEATKWLNGSETKTYFFRFDGKKVPNYLYNTLEEAKERFELIKRSYDRHDTEKTVDSINLTFLETVKKEEKKKENDRWFFGLLPL